MLCLHSTCVKTLPSNFLSSKAVGVLIDSGTSLTPQEVVQVKPHHILCDARTFPGTLPLWQPLQCRQ